MKNTPFVPLHKLFNCGAARQCGKERGIGTVEKVAVLCVFTVWNILTLFYVQAEQNICWSTDKANQYALNDVKIFKIQITAMKYASPYNSIFNRI